MARPKSETRNHKNLRLIQAMPESLLGWQGEDRMRKLEYVTSEKFPITLCSDKVNKERGSTTGSLREPQLCHHQGRKSQGPGWHMEIQHTIQTSVKTSVMNTPLSLLRLFKIKQTAIKVLRVVMK